MNKVEKNLIRKPKRRIFLEEEVYEKPNKTRIIAICNQKGGCGKTTTVINVASGLALLGQKVLIVDLDSQCNATTGVGINLEDVELSLFDLMVEPKKYAIEDIILETQYENLHIAPGSIELAEFESRVANEIGRENRLKKGLSSVYSYYDYIVIDTPPSLGLLSINALNFSNEVFITLQAHPFAFDGLNLLLNTIQLIRDEINPKLIVGGVVVTMFDSRTKISREIYEKVLSNENVGEKLFKTSIKQNIKIAEAAKFRKSIITYDFDCTGAQDYLNLCKEICEQTKKLNEQVKDLNNNLKNSNTINSSKSNSLQEVL